MAFLGKMIDRPLKISLVLVCLLPIGATAADKPDVLFIAIDDMNDRMTFFDDDNPIRTPSLKRLAKRGTFFSTQVPEIYRLNSIRN